MTMLKTLRLRDAVVSSGPLPSSLGSLSQLRSLVLSGGRNNLGTLPPEWSRLQNLQQLYLWNMSLTGQLPSSYSNLTMLIDLDLRNVTGLTSTLADWLAFIKRPGVAQTQEVALESMGLQGSLPAEMLDPNRSDKLQVNKFKVPHIPADNLAACHSRMKSWGVSCSLHACMMYAVSGCHCWRAAAQSLLNSTIHHRSYLPSLPSELCCVQDELFVIEE